jgi:hypothetical protein
LPSIHKKLDSGSPEQHTIKKGYFNFHIVINFYDVPRIAKFIETESRMVDSRDWKKRVMGVNAS